MSPFKVKLGKKRMICNSTQSNCKNLLRKRLAMYAQRNLPLWQKWKTTKNIIEVDFKRCARSLNVRKEKVSVHPKRRNRARHTTSQDERVRMVRGT
ncbi:hypothetical protein ACE6H2_006366 [Prunus campanulata]